MSVLFKALLFIPFLSLGQTTYLEAYSLFNNKEYSVSENVLKFTLIDNPNNTKSLELLGSIYVIQKDWEEAASLYKNLVRIDSSNAEYHYQYGNSLGKEALKSNIFSAFMMKSTVLNEFLTAVSLDENHIDAIWALIVYYTELPSIIGGSLENAKQYADQLETISAVDYYLAYGYIFEEENDYLLAEQNYLIAIDVGESITCYQALISFYEKQQEFLKAINYLEIAYSKHDWNNFNFQIGKIVASHQFELDKGAESLKSYLNNYSSTDTILKEKACYYLAKIYRYKNDRENALKWIRNSLDENPNFEDAIKEEKLILKM
jgi:tetratricopeptide (TPR) repeat protein